MSDSPLIDRLIEALRCLPGVGPKSSQRIAYHLLERNREGARRLAVALQEAADGVGRCGECRTLSENVLCRLCASDKRNAAQLCVVENPVDVQAIEHTTSYQGRYFVLMGHLSPLDGIGPEDIGLDQLEQRFRQGRVSEVILATNPTVEGEATAHYIADMAREHGIRASRIAYGVPFGGELEYVDAGTLSHAIAGRRDI
ncbi:MAG: recombination protein RecR [Gammaproteobacteria bacterium]|nr:recombination protein RecR [Gammaproteobacteria bacterium]